MTHIHQYLVPLHTDSRAAKKGHRNVIWAIRGKIVPSLLIIIIIIIIIIFIIIIIIIIVICFSFISVFLSFFNAYINLVVVNT